MIGTSNNRGWGLVAAGIVLGVGTVIRMIQDEPAGALAVTAIVFAALGVKSLYSTGSETV